MGETGYLYKSHSYKSYWIIIHNSSNQGTKNMNIAKWKTDLKDSDK